MNSGLDDPRPRPLGTRNCEDQGPLDPVVVQASGTTDSDLPHIPVVIGDQEYRALIDTGSSANIVSRKIVKSMTHLTINPTKTSLCGINKTPIEVVGEAEVIMKMGDRECMVPSIIADIMSDVVLGNPFLRTYGTLVDLPKGQLVFPSDLPDVPEMVTVSSTSMSRSDQVQIFERDPTVVSQQSHVIKPYHYKWIVGVMKDGNSIPADGLIVMKLTTQPSEVPSQRVKPDKSGTGCLLLLVNYLDDNLELEQGEVVGEVHTHMSNQIPLDFDREGKDCAMVHGCGELNLSDSDIDKRWQKLLKTLGYSNWNLSEAEKGRVVDALRPFQFSFALEGEPLGVLIGYEHQIEVEPGVKPVSQKPRPLPANKLEEVDRQVNDLLERGLIKPSRSNWASPVVLVEKANHGDPEIEDGKALKSYRMAIDYRKLNQVSLKDSYPLPNINFLLSNIPHSKYFSSMDLASGYHQLKIRHSDTYLTAFCTPTGLWEFVVMPFGLSGAPPSFVRAMNLVLKLDRNKVLVYLDDVMVLGVTFEQHLESLVEVLASFQRANLKLKAKKTNLFATSIRFLGHLVSEQGITCTDDKIKCMKELPYPNSPKEVRSYLGVFGFYRKFVKDYSIIARPLHKLTTLDKKDFVFTPEAKEAFDKLREKLINPPILALPQENDKFILTCDSSGYGIGGVLSIERESKRMVVAYASHLLESSRLNYPVTKKELYAVVYYVQYYRIFLLPRPFVVESDHRCLQYLASFKEPSGMIMRWLTILAEYNFEIVYRKGTSGPMKTADLLSRVDPAVVREVASIQFPNTTTPLPVYQGTPKPITSVKLNVASSSDHPPMAVCTADSTEDYWVNYCKVVEQDQKKDKNIVKLVLLLLASPEGHKLPASESPMVRFYWSRRKNLQLNRGVLFYLDKMKVPRIVVPSHKTQDFLRLAHDHTTAGHRSAAKMLPLLRSRCHWYLMRADIIQHTRECRSCGFHNKPKRFKFQAPLNMTKTSFRFERLSIDMLGPLTRTSGGNTFALVGVCCFTKFAFSFPLTTTDSETIARILLSRWVCFFGLPTQIHSDKGSNFVSALIQQVYKLLNIKQTHSLAYTSQCNGAAERTIQTLKNMVRHYADTKPRSWDKYLPMCVLAYNNQIHSATKVLPQEMIFGEPARLPVDLVWGAPPTLEDVDEQTFVGDLRRQLHSIQEYARVNLEASIQTSKDFVDKGQFGKPHQVGDLVWLLKGEFSSGSRKFQRKYEGVFVVKDRPTFVSYIIEHLETCERQTVHFNRLKKAYLSAEKIQKKVSRNQEGSKLNISSDLVKGESSTSPNDEEWETDSEVESDDEDPVVVVVEQQAARMRVVPPRHVRPPVLPQRGVLIRRNYNLRNRVAGIITRNLKPFQ